MSTPLVAWLLLALAQEQEPLVSTPEVLVVGHAVQVRGSLDESGRFVAQKLEIEGPTSDDVLVGTIPEDQTDPLGFTLLGQRVETDDTTEWRGVSPGSLAGQRVKVEGSWKGPRLFRAEVVEPRGPGRDRIGARLDGLRRVEGGWEARVMIFTVVIPDGTEVEHALPVAEYALAPERKTGVASPDDGRLERDEDDLFGKGIALTDALRLLGQIETRVDHESEYDLNEDVDQDRLDVEGSLRLRLLWTPSTSLVGVLDGRYRELYRREEGLPSDWDGAFTLGEAWLQWRDVADHEGFDLTVGRQDFDDPREWIYDQNLDALRATWIRPRWRLDLSGSTTLTDGTDRDQQAWNAIAYLSNNDRDEHLAAWALLRDTDDVPLDVRNPNTGNDDPVRLAESSLHVGVRALGEWLPQQEVWGELAYQVGERDAAVTQGTTTGVEEVDVSAWAYDVGTTWFPRFAEPLYFTIGYAFAAGAQDPAESFRQTGYQDNTARFGGITSFRYYGELLDPELSNLGITTLGVGARLTRRTSLDLVFHTYTQDYVAPLFSPRPSIEANLDRQPNGVDGDLGWELDAILGYREIRNFDVELVGATFEPGDGFDREDTAYLLKLQLRYRF